jgi:hypothetical protein
VNVSRTREQRYRRGLIGPAATRRFLPTQDRILLLAPGLVVAVRASGEAVCPYCKASAEAEALTTCPACRTPHHAACWAEAGGCTLLGCVRRERAARTR